METPLHWCLRAPGAILAAGVAASVLAAVGGCGSAGSSEDSQRQVPMDSGRTIDAPPTNPLLVTQTHSGWKKQLCLGCHGKTVKYPHADAAYSPPNCVNCHGYNGAPHKDHATTANPRCTECHGDVDHVSAFTAPVDCVACHYHPAK